MNRHVNAIAGSLSLRPPQRIVNDLDGGFGIQMFGHLAKKRAVHARKHISDVVDYVRRGKKNNFD